MLVRVGVVKVTSLLAKAGSGLGFSFGVRACILNLQKNAQQAQLFMENMRSLDVAAFSTDRHLLQDLVEFQVLTHGTLCAVKLGAL